MHIHLYAVRHAVRREQAVHQKLQSIGFLDDDLRILMKRRSIELAVEKLCGTAYSAQRILDLVREIADQLAIRLILIEHPFFTLDTPLLVDMPELDQKPPPVPRASISTGVTVQESCRGV